MPTRPLIRTGSETRLELGERLRRTADPLHRLDLPVSDREDRPDVQEVPGEAGRLTDPSAPHEVLERLDGEDDSGLAEEARDQGVDFLVVGPTVEPALDRLGEH